MLYEQDAVKLLPRRFPDSHKGTYGRALLICGSRGMAGAAYLAAMSAYRSGCGLVEIFTHEDNRVILQQLIPEAILTAYRDETADELCDKLVLSMQKADAVAIGPGLGLDETASLLLSHVCRFISTSDLPLVVDADAITLLADRSDLLNNLSGHNVVLTPHPKEMAVLMHMTTDEVESEREQTLDSLVSKARISCLLKGHHTLVGSPEAETYANCTGNDGMAVGGSGDVLTGLICGLSAQGMKVAQAAQLGAYIHGVGGDLAAENVGRHSMIARDIIDGIVRFIKRTEDLTNESE